MSQDVVSITTSLSPGGTLKIMAAPALFHEARLLPKIALLLRRILTLEQSVSDIRVFPASRTVEIDLFIPPGAHRAVAARYSEPTQLNLILPRQQKIAQLNNPQKLTLNQHIATDDGSELELQAVYPLLPEDLDVLCQVEGVRGAGYLMVVTIPEVLHHDPSRALVYLAPGYDPEALFGQLQKVLRASHT